jgi:hypothetical protein
MLWTSLRTDQRLPACRGVGVLPHRALALVAFLATIRCAGNTRQHHHSRQRCRHVVVPVRQRGAPPCGRETTRSRFGVTETQWTPLRIARSMAPSLAPPSGRQGLRGASTRPDRILGVSVPPSDEQSTAELRARAARARRLAETFQYDESAPRLRALADDLQARADPLEGAVADKVDE